jgi:hypothetical protein
VLKNNWHTAESAHRHSSVRHEASKHGECTIETRRMRHKNTVDAQTKAIPATDKTGPLRGINSKYH